MPAIYQADVWCDSCANAIRDRILGDPDLSDEQRATFDDERAYDSDEYPKYMSDDEESDCPQHCGAGEECIEAETLSDGQKIGALLSTALTSDGVEYVKAAAAEGGAVAEFWRAAFYWIDFPSDESEDD